jgi:hypothetical protein
MPTVSFSELLGDLRQIGIIMPDSRIQPTDMMALIDTDSSDEKKSEDPTHSRR